MRVAWWWAGLLACLCTAAGAQVGAELPPLPGGVEGPAGPAPAGTAVGPVAGPALGPEPPRVGPLTLPAPAASAADAARRPTVAIREFRSSVGEVAPRGATDMFTAALVRSGRFRVLERARLAEGVGLEKALNQQGLSSGDSGQRQLLQASYMVEASISEASAGDRRTAFSVGLAGAVAAQGSTTDSLAIDVRVVEVDSGLVVAAVTVRQPIRSVETRVGGLGSALANLLTRGRGGPVVEALSPTDQFTSARRDSVDLALREAIEASVGQLVARLTLE